MHSATISETVKQRRGLEMQELSFSGDGFSLFSICGAPPLPGCLLEVAANRTDYWTLNGPTEKTSSTYNKHWLTAFCVSCIVF